jgi:CubicO group peptidase (beta-lactamase class C family)
MDGQNRIPASTRRTFLLATSCAAISARALDAEAQVRAQPLQTQQLQLQQLPSELTEARVRAHVIAPAALRSVQTEKQVRAVRLAIPAIARQFSATPALDVGAFGLGLHNVLRNAVTGYILQITRNGTPIHLGIWNWAQTPADAGLGWNENTRMHLASVSKLLTAVGVTKALGGLSYDTKIINYLPTYWSNRRLRFRLRPDEVQGRSRRLQCRRLVGLRKHELRSHAHPHPHPPRRCE